MTTSNIKQRSNKKIKIAVLIFFLLFFLLSPEVFCGEKTVIKIGVLAKRGTEICLQKWSPTAEYLTHTIAGSKFIISPLDFEEVYHAVEKGEIDFVLTNPSIYVELEAEHEINRIATLKNLRLGRAYTEFCGVVFCRSDRNDIKHLADIRKKNFMAVKETSFGGWRMAWREFQQKGIDPYRDFATLKFGGTQDAVVYSVLKGKVDAGTVRTDTLERMAFEGKIKLKDFRVIHEHGGKDIHFPFLHSTRAYPEWPFAKLRYTPHKLAEKVAIALIAMPASSDAAKAAKCAGWTIPHSYQPVHECLKELKLAPYKDIRKITIADAFKKFRYLILMTTFLIIVMAGSMIFFLHSNQKVKTAHSKLKSEIRVRNHNIDKGINWPDGRLVRYEMKIDIHDRKKAEETLRKSEEKYRSIYENAIEGFYQSTPEGRFISVNPAFAKLLGYASPEELISIITDITNQYYVDPEDRRQFRQLLEKTGFVKKFEFKVQRKDGSHIWVSNSTRSVYAPDGSVLP